MGMRVTGDFGANVQLEGGLFLQALDTWTGFIRNREVRLQNHAAERMDVPIDYIREHSGQ